MTTDDPPYKSGTIDSYNHITGTGYVDGIWFHINDVHEGLRQFLRPGLVVSYLLRKGKRERATHLDSDIDLQTFEFSGEYNLTGVEEITNTDVQRKISDITNNKGAVLLLGLHQRYPKAIVKNMNRENKHKAIKRYLEESLPDIIVEQHDTFPKKRGDKESSPFLKSFCGTFFL